MFFAIDHNYRHVDTFRHIGIHIDAVLEITVARSLRLIAVKHLTCHCVKYDLYTVTSICTEHEIQFLVKRIRVNRNLQGWLMSPLTLLGA